MDAERPVRLTFFGVGEPVTVFTDVPGTNPSVTVTSPGARLSGLLRTCLQARWAGFDCLRITVSREVELRACSDSGAADLADHMEAVPVGPRLANESVVVPVPAMISDAAMIEVLRSLQRAPAGEMRSRRCVRVRAQRLAAIDQPANAELAHVDAVPIRSGACGDRHLFSICCRRRRVNVNFVPTATPASAILHSRM